MYGYADIAHSDVGAINGSIGTTHSESIDIAEATRQKEVKYQRKRLALLCRPARHIAGRGEGNGLCAPCAVQQDAAKKRMMKYVLIGLVGFLAFKGLRG